MTRGRRAIDYPLRPVRRRGSSLFTPAGGRAAVEVLGCGHERVCLARCQAQHHRCVKCSAKGTETRQTPLRAPRSVDPPYQPTLGDAARQRQAQGQDRPL